MTINKEVEFNNIISDILKNKEFIDLKYEIHHGISRLDHSLNVARLTYKMCKRLHVKNYEEITRAALLHDFFRTEDVPEKCFLNHPLKAVENSKKNFEISDFQENIIAAHMFPVTKNIPKHVGSWIVSGADKAVAIYECTKYKVPLTIGAAFLFCMNICFIQR
ncbi:MAG TPA: HD domain-containing protein [Candidatus Onthocola stercoravium]|nr:HD domain-containing protein [Candidatus Onthocola stercoravium]